MRWSRYAFWFAALGIQACACASRDVEYPFSSDAAFDHDRTIDSVADASADQEMRLDGAQRDGQIERGHDARADPNRRGPPYPVVLAHGFLGFDAFAGNAYVQYFFGVREHLRALGESELFSPAVDPFQTSAHRAQQLAAEIAAILRDTGAAKVNIIAHSQGGLDARVVAALHPEWVASVTTISTPHRGTAVADVALGLVADARLREAADAVVRLFARPLYDAAGNETSVFAALRQLSRNEMRSFNDEFPNAPTVSYFSIAGRSAAHYGLNACSAHERPSFITRLDNYIDVLDPAFAVTGSIADGDGILPAAHDGLVAVESAKWGRFLGCVPADHMDEVGQILGDSPGLLNPFEHLGFYTELVRWLRSQGL